MTKEELKDFLMECAERYLDWGYERKLLKEPKNRVKAENER